MALKSLVTQFQFAILIKLLPLDTDNYVLFEPDEINIYRTNPNDIDMDDDGLSDGNELNQYGTDPLDIDRDDDGSGDGKEILLGFDPLDPKSKPEEGDGRSDSRFTEIGLFAVALSIFTIGGYGVSKYVRRYRRLGMEDTIDYLEKAQSLVDEIDIG